MKPVEIIVAGAGYAGIHTIQALLHTCKQALKSGQITLTLLNDQPYHLRKVLLFRPVVDDEEIRIPLEQLFPEQVSFIHGRLTELDRDSQTLTYRDSAGKLHSRRYDRLVLALGSVGRRPAPEQGGLNLAQADDGLRIRNKWQALLKQHARACSVRTLRIAVAGAGTSGIETAAELACQVRREAADLGLAAESVRIDLYNARQRLFPQSPPKLSKKLECLLQEIGVDVHHQLRVEHATDAEVYLSDGTRRPAALCIWTLGLLPNPQLARLGLPLTEQGGVSVDAHYRINGWHGAYSIGDCATIIDPRSGAFDGMTCREAINQANRLVAVITADLANLPAPVHEPAMIGYCLSLGPERGIAWVHKWGLDLIFTGKLGRKIRTHTWDAASLLKR